MNNTPLNWAELAEALRPSLRRLRIVLELPAFSGERAFIRLHDDTRTESITETRSLLDGNQMQLSARERAAVEILHEVGPSHARKGRFNLTRAQIGRLLAFAAELSIEVEGKGTISVMSKPARIVGKLRDTDEGVALCFLVVDSDGEIIKEPQVVGDREAYVLDEQLKMYRMSFSMLPSEAQALVGSEPLLLGGLVTDEGRAGFEAVVALGADVADLIEVAHQSDPPARITLRAMLTGGDDKDSTALRVHLVTELGHNGQRDEVEVSSRGALSPVHALPVEGVAKNASLKNGALKNGAAKVSNNPVGSDINQIEKIPFLAVTRPLDLEEEARQALFDLGLTPASAHRGYVAVGEKALDILMRLTDVGGLPSFVLTDPDTLPIIIRVPAQPRLFVRFKAGASAEDMLDVRFDLCEDARKQGVPYDVIVQAASEGRTAALVDDDVVIGFTAEHAKLIQVIGNALDIHNTETLRSISADDFKKVLVKVRGEIAGKISEKIEIVCADDELLAELQEILSQ